MGRARSGQIAPLLAPIRDEPTGARETLARAARDARGRSVPDPSTMCASSPGLQHFFEAIDCVLCWRVDRTGDIFERDSQGDAGALRPRAAPVLTPALDTFQIEHDYKGNKRIIPVLELSRLWPTTRRGRGRGRG